MGSRYDGFEPFRGLEGKPRDLSKPSRMETLGIAVAVIVFGAMALAIVAYSAGKEVGLWK